MNRRLLRHAFTAWIMSASLIGCVANAATLVRVIDGTGVEGIGGVVLLVNPGDQRKSQVFLTNADGHAYLPHLNCEICTITALDPRGVFFNKTTEFSGQSSSVTLTLQLRPVIDTVGCPHCIWVNIAVHGPADEPLLHQSILVRPSEMRLNSNGLYTETTDSKGQIKVQLTPGEYTVATLLEGKAWEAPLRVASESKRRNAKQGAEPIAVRLSAASPTPR